MNALRKTKNTKTKERQANEKEQQGSERDQATHPDLRSYGCDP